MRRAGGSLRAKLFALCLCVILIMSLLCGLILFSEYQAIVSLTGSLNSIDSFYLFSSSLTRFDQTFNLYANSLSRIYLEDCYDLLDALERTSREMAEEFPDEVSIAENQALIGEYVSSSRALLDEGAALTEPEFWNRYDGIRARLHQIDANLREMQRFYLGNIASTSDDSLDFWRVQMRLSFMVAAICLCLLLVFIDWIIGSITSPVMRLADYAKRIAGGDFSRRFTAPARAGSEEIALLNDAVAYMSETIERQMQALQDKIELSKRLHALEIQNMNIQLSLAEKEMQLMQSMINPHFLFNCLSTVSGMAVLENAPRTRDISIRIARYLRSTIDLVGARITLGRELELLRQYLYIQSLRLGERVQTNVQCDPQCESARVPAMFLQPIAENAVVHGLRDCVSGGKLSVTAVRLSDSVEVVVSDNGRGMSRVRVSELLESIHAPFQGSQKRIGLHSVVSQLDSVFGEGYSFDMESEQGVGTTVRIRFALFMQDAAERRSNMAGRDNQF
ncbi:MAG: histidine kinase [Clostridia bacterium]|nr:histidine kinase [Clostridia bacterium]